MHQGNGPQHNDITKIQQRWQSGALPPEAGEYQGTAEQDDWCEHG